jgi:hypothetical protein
MSDAATPLINFIQLWISGAFYMELLPDVFLSAFVASSGILIVRFARVWIFLAWSFELFWLI